ncbi:response regulator transcription factor [Oleiharenicola lentus]|jgi:two-component system response regulator DevR|uniref:Response regulator transcription factor n=1 Tax=Oleiharenicola lentus TaxID=2508720 RepID=A0A4Q1C7W5_9BACT|nr:response regulator transcription factor [Oleiharenicola lentus]RXK55023.1 response regulator transcription factor [Oleiharenicola lentus]
MTTTHSISVLIVDDSELVRAGLKSLLDQRGEEQDFQVQVIGEAASMSTAVSEAGRLNPDVVLLDIRLPDGSGLTACRQILANSSDVKVLVLTSVIDDNLVYEAMSSGAHGYLLKEIDAQGLCRAITDVAAGKFILDPSLTTRVLNLVRSGGNVTPEQNKLAILSAQERRVLALVAEGKTNKEIAEQMGLSDKTVKNYLSNVFEKLKINRRSQAAVMYLEHRGRPDIRP